MDKDITLEQEFDLVFKAHYSLVKNFALMLLKSHRTFSRDYGPNRRFGRITPG